MKKSYLLIAMLCMFLFSFAAWAEVNINTASAQELSAKLNNIGPAKAAAIVEYRQTNGEFKSLEGLMDIQGIGPATLEMNRAIMSLGTMAPSQKSSSNMQNQQAAGVITNVVTSEQ